MGFKFCYNIFVVEIWCFREFTGIYNYWLMLFASFFIVYVYDVTDVTQRALLEYLSTNVPVCESN